MDRKDLETGQNVILFPQTYSKTNPICQLDKIGLANFSYFTAKFCHIFFL